MVCKDSLKSEWWESNPMPRSMRAQWSDVIQALLAVTIRKDEHRDIHNNCTYTLRANRWARYSQKRIYVFFWGGRHNMHMSLKIPICRQSNQHLLRGIHGSPIDVHRIMNQTYTMYTIRTFMYVFVRAFGLDTEQIYSSISLRSKRVSLQLEEEDTNLGKI